MRLSSASYTQAGQSVKGSGGVSMCVCVALVQVSMSGQYQQVVQEEV